MPRVANYDEKIQQLQEKINKKQEQLAKLREKLHEVEAKKDSQKYDELFTYIKDKNLDPNVIMDAIKE